MSFRTNITSMFPGRSSCVLYWRYSFPRRFSTSGTCGFKAITIGSDVSTIVSPIADVRIVAQVPGKRPVLRRHHSDSNVFFRRIRSRNRINFIYQPQKIAFGVRVTIGI